MSYVEYKKNQIDKHFHKCENINYSIIVYNYARIKGARIYERSKN